MDILDFENIKDTYVLTGTYRPKKSSEGIWFDYEIVDEPRRSYGHVVNNLIADNSVQVIKSNDDIGFKVRGYIVTQDDELWQITEVIKRMQEINRDVLRVLKSNPSSEYLIAMTRVQNPMDIK